MKNVELERPKIIQKLLFKPVKMLSIVDLLEDGIYLFEYDDGKIVTIMVENEEAVQEDVYDNKEQFVNYYGPDLMEFCRTIGTDYYVHYYINEFFPEIKNAYHVI